MMTTVFAIIGEPLLRSAGFEDEFSHQIGLFIRNSIPAYLACTIYVTNAFYLMAQDKFQVNANLCIVAIASQLIYAPLLLGLLDEPMVAVALSKFFTMTTTIAA